MKTITYKIKNRERYKNAIRIIEEKDNRSRNMAIIGRREKALGEPVKTLISLIRKSFVERFNVQTISKNDDSTEVVRVTDCVTGFRFEFSRELPPWDEPFKRAKYGSKERLIIWPHEGYFTAGRGAEWMSIEEITYLCIEITDQKNKIYFDNLKLKREASERSKNSGRSKVAEIYGVSP